MLAPYSLDPDDDLPHGLELVADDPPEPVTCRRCGDPVAAWERSCSSCGSTLGRPRPAAPPDGDVPYAEEVDVDDVFDVPVADVITDEYGVPVLPQARRRRRRRPRPPTVGWERLLPMFIGYGVMMAVSVAFGVLLIAVMLNNATMDEDDLNWAMFAIESIDAVLVLIVAFAVGKLPARPIDLSHRVGTWFIGFPLLAFLLTVNIGFMLLLRNVFNVEGELGPPITVVTVLLMCVQPAIVEEWFFRHLALGSLREKMGTKWAVWASAGMFALAHIFNPVGMPYLLVLGVALGYLRIHSGSLALPMLLHFLHNLAVLFANRML